MCYGIGGVPNQVASSAVAFYLQLFLLDVAQVSVDSSPWALYCLSSSLVSGSFTPPLLPPTPSLARGTSKLDRKPNATEGSLLMDIYFRLFVVEKCETMWMSNNIEVIG